MIMNLRQMLYRAASILGDLKAVQRGPVAIVKRVARKEVTKVASRLINRVLR